MHNLRYDPVGCDINETANYKSLKQKYLLDDHDGKDSDHQKHAIKVKHKADERMKMRKRCNYDLCDNMREENQVNYHEKLLIDVVIAGSIPCIIVLIIISLT